MMNTAAGSYSCNHSNGKAYAENGKNIRLFLRGLGHFFSLIIIALLINSCGKDGFPVPPASTVPLFTYTLDNDGFAPATVVFSNTSIVPDEAGVPSYSWNFGDGSSSTEVSPTHLFAGPGVYDVKLTIRMSVSLEIKELIQSILIKNANAAGTPMYFTNGKTVYTGYLNDDKPVFTPLSIGPFKDAYDLAIDTVHSKLYISDFDGNKIFQCDLDGKNLIAFRTNLLGPDGLEIDYDGNRLFWDTDDGVQYADLSSSDVNQKVDFVTGQANDPEGVSIDPVNKVLYWTNYNGGVWKKNLDGTGETEILPAVEGGSTLVVGDRLYYDQFVATGDIHLKSAKLDGSDVSLIATSITKVVFGIGYDPTGQKIYWGDRSVVEGGVTFGKIMRANLDGTGIETFYTAEALSPRGIVFGKKK